MWYKRGMSNEGTGVLGLSAMGHRGYGVHLVKMGHMDNGIQGVWDIWAMRPTGGYGYRGMGHGHGHMGYGVQRGMGHVGY